MNECDGNSEGVMLDMETERVQGSSSATTPQPEESPLAQKKVDGDTVSRGGAAVRHKYVEEVEDDGDGDEDDEDDEDMDEDEDEDVDEDEDMEDVEDGDEDEEDGRSSDSGTQDHNDECCAVCGTDDRPKSLLCCDNCPKIYHLACLQPPKSSIPRGDWYCPDCSRKFALIQVEKILASRTCPDDKVELYVKWKNTSYMHCSWVKEEDAISVQKLYPAIRVKLRNWHKLQSMGGVSVDNPEEYENGIYKKWLMVDRIVSKRTSATNPDAHSYLVKWQELPYDECTWEAEELLSEWKDEIARYETENPITQDSRMRKRAESDDYQVKKHRRKRSKRDDGKVEGERMFSSTPDFLGKGLTLHPYQLEGLNWLYFKWQQRENVILADEMGLGKTIQSIAFLAALWAQYADKPHLVVVPLSTLQNWEREFALWASQLRVVSLTGNQESRDILLKYEIFRRKTGAKRKGLSREELQEQVRFHVCLISYEMCVAHANFLSKVDYECLIVDEGHRLKTKTSKLVKELSNFNFTHRVLLTGTPLQNNIQELFMLLHFLDGRKFDSWNDFENSFANISDEEQVAQLHNLLSPHLLRRLKKDVLQQLPPKKEQIVRVELSGLQREVYKQILTQSYRVLAGGKTGQTIRTGMNNVVNELRKCCLHPYLIEGVESTDSTEDGEEDTEKLVNASGKLALLDKMLHRLLDRGHRVLIYSQFVIMLDILEEYLVARDWGFQRIDGRVGGSERQGRIDKYNTQTEKFPIFLLSTRAGGLGLNLATADTVIIFDSDWNPHNDLQAQARAHRLGQEKAVMIYRLVTRSSIEERMMQIAKRKVVLEHLVVRKMGSKQDLKQEELDDILRYGAAELFNDNAQNSEDVDEKKAEESQKAEAGKGKPMLVRDLEAARLKVKRTDRIVYDDAALDRLLDRSGLTNEAEREAEEGIGEDALMTSFKVANFYVINSSDKEENDSNEDNQEDVAVPATVEPEFWRSLLKDRCEEVLGEENASMDLEPSRRRGRRINYCLDGEIGEEASSDDYDAAAHSQDESSLIDGNAERTGGWKRKDIGAGGAGEASKRARIEDSSEQVVRVSGSGPSLLVLGYNAKERQSFLNCLLKHGLPANFHDGGSGVDWSNFMARLPRKRHKDICAYTRMVLKAAGGDCEEGILPEDVLFETKPEDLLSRIGTIHLFRTKLEEPDYKNQDTFQIKHPSAKLLKTRVWKASHDWALLKGLLKYGYGRWQDILLDSERKLQEVLHQELNIDVAEIMNIDQSDQSVMIIDEAGQASPSDKPQANVQNTISKLRSMETKCRNWLGNRVRLLAEGLSGNGGRQEQASRDICGTKRGRGRVARPGRQPSRPLQSRHEALRDKDPLLDGRNHVTSDVPSRGGPHLPGLPVLQFYPGNSADEICTRMQIVHTYNSMCSMCHKIRSDASAVGAVRSMSSSDALMEAGIIFRQQLEDLEIKASALIEKLPPGDHLPRQTTSSALQQNSGHFAIRGTVPSSSMLPSQSTGIPPHIAPPQISRSGSITLTSTPVAPSHPGVVPRPDGNFISTNTRIYHPASATLSSSSIRAEHGAQPIGMVENNPLQLDGQIQDGLSQATNLARQLTDDKLIRVDGHQDPNGSLGTRHSGHEVVIIDD